MERPFWTVGPVPPAHLAELGIPRPAAQAALLAALERDGIAWIGGPPGSGRTTLVHQVASGLGRPFVVVDRGALLRGDEAEALQAVRDLSGRPAADAGWAAALRLWRP